jgi:penicillin-binding protein 1C
MSVGAPLNGVSARKAIRWLSHAYPISIFSAAALAALWIASAFIVPIGDGAFEAVYAHARGESIRIYSSDGRLLREAVNESGERMERVSIDDICPLLLDALVSVEDERFYSHSGVDLVAMARALAQNAAAGSAASGASTITMQLARIVDGLPRSLLGKLAQIREAILLERSLTKRQILELYANLAPFGGGCVGVEAASKRWLGKPSSDLSASEAAFLAGLPQSPTLYDPSRRPESAEARRRFALSRMLATGAIDGKLFVLAINEPVRVANLETRVLAGHFTDWVLSLDPGPGDVRTTLDLDLQAQIEAIVADHVGQFEDEGLTNAAVVVLDVETGGVLALVGSRGWGDPEDGAVNGALARRQPGSALKPFMYELAFELGASPNDLLADIETEYYGSDRTLYVPENYSETFRGPVLAQQALSWSLNVPAIRLLNERVGLDRFVERLKRLGFSGLTEDPERYGLGIVLGSCEVSPLELAGAYSTLARGGIRIDPSPWLRSGDGPSGFSERAEGSGERVMDEKCAWLITSILSDEFARTQAFGPANPLLLGFPFAIKTGTSSNWRDSWTAGYDSRYAIVAWGGDFRARPMRYLSGSSGSGFLFNRIVRLLVDRDRGFAGVPPAPEGVGFRRICSLSGKKPGRACGTATMAPMLDSTQLEECTVHRIVRIDARTGAEAGADCPSRFVEETVATVLPPIFDRWLNDAGFSAPNPSAPSAMSHKESALRIVKPRTGDVFIIEPGYDLGTQTIELVALAGPATNTVSWLVDGIPVAEAAWPFTAAWQMRPGVHVIIAKSSDFESDPVIILVK